MPVLLSEITDLKGERAAHIVRMRQMLDSADGRKMTGEEETEYTRLEADVDSKGKRAALLQTEYDEERAEIEREHGLDGRKTQGGDGGEDRAQAEQAQRYADTFDSYMRRGINELDLEERQTLALGRDSRDQAKSSNAGGGYLVPTDFQRQLQQFLVQAGSMRQTRATVLVTGAGETIQVPKTTAHGAANWVAEAAQITATDETFGQASLGAFKAVRMAKVSFELLSDNAVDLEGYLSRELGRSIGQLENTGYVVGTGTTQPTGIVGSATLGKTGATGQTTSITSDDLIDLLYSLLPPYRRDAEWLLNDGTLKSIRKLKDSTGQYIWSAGLTGDQPDRLLNKVIWDDPDVAVMAASAKSVICGDLSTYWIRDVGQAGPLSTEKGVGSFFVRRLDERYADTGQVGFLGWHRTDGTLCDTTGAVKYYQNSAT